MQPKVTLGSLHQIQSISHIEPLKIRYKEKQQLVHQSNSANTTQNHLEVFSVNKRGKSADEQVQKNLREVDLQGLNEKERQAFKLLREDGGL